MKNSRKDFLFTLLTAGMIISTLSTKVLGQDDYAPKYLLQNKLGEVHVSGFGSYIIGFSDVDGSFAVYNGGGGAVLLNQTFYFGGYGMGLSTSHKHDPVSILGRDNQVYDYDDLYTTFGHGGFWLGYLHNSYKPVHWGVSTKLGWGSVDLNRRQSYPDSPDFTYDYFSSDNVFVVNPQFEVEMNMLKWFKINASAGYQFVTGVNQTYTAPDGTDRKFFTSSDFSSPMVNLSFVFGGFGGRR